MKNKWRGFKIFFLSIIIGAFTILVTVKPEWVARFSAAAYICWLSTVALLSWSLNPRNDFLVPNSQIAIHGNERKKKFARLATRIFYIFIGSLSLYLSIPIAQDANAILKGGYESLVPIVGAVVDDTYFFGTDFLSQDVDIKKPGEEKPQTYYLNFCRQRMEKGKIYKFMTTPHAKLILDVKG